MAAKKDDEQGSAFDRLKEEARSHLSARAQSLADKAGEKVTELTGKLTESVGGPAGEAGKRVMEGESPVKAMASEKAKDVKDKAVGKIKEAFGGGTGSTGDTKVTNIVESIDIPVPLRTVYDHWTQFEDFSSFMKGVKSVTQNEDEETDWKVKVFLSERSWTATIQEQVPDDRIVWTSEGSKGSTAGAVTFHELAPHLTRVVAVVEYYPSGFFEKTGNLWRAQGRRLRLDLKHFARHVTLGPDPEIEGWRGEIRDGEVVRTDEEAREDEDSEEEYEDGYDEDENDEDDENEEDEEDGEYDDEDEEERR
ncbi:MULTISPECIES: SRPBCC family protein [Streptomyces]|uniref:SRPBCC family protein n=1 Tax=Streptomyces fungicidicus TaxID=68203 RepID=A0ACC7Y5U3_9ACTN|nr:MULTISPECIES: SRPBCC family protein [Streptomyces]MBF4136685.1 SRPBCC family protein [Streptomyces albidoflavus]NUV77338.1 SRPBCC family protein [Streptomyces fungicidicus]